MPDMIIEQLRSLRLTAFSEALEQQRQQPTTYAELGFEERLTLLLDSELMGRENNRIKRLRKQAKFRLAALPERLDYSPERELKKTVVAELLNGNYVNRQQNILLTGATGCGKTYLACAFGEQAVRQQHTVRYYRLGRLLDELDMARADGSYRQQLNRLSKITLLILDDWGLEPLTTTQGSDLLEVMEDRYRLGSTIIASQVPVKDWHQLIPNPTIADALLDRLVHDGQKIALKGDTMRKRNLT
jgi:DNA replication protein DnaC